MSDEVQIALLKYGTGTTLLALFIWVIAPKIVDFFIYYAQSKIDLKNLEKKISIQHKAEESRRIAEIELLYSPEKRAFLIDLVKNNGMVRIQYNTIYFLCDSDGYPDSTGAIRLNKQGIRGQTPN